MKLKPLNDEEHMISEQALVDINKSALEFHNSTVSRVKKLSSPLKYLGITTFGYMKMFSDSRYLHICDHDEWSKYYFRNIHDAGTVFSKIISMVGLDITPYIWPTDKMDKLLFNLKRHNIFHGLTFYRRTGDYIEHWSFCTEPNNTQIYNLYFQQKDLLWKFVQYFCDNAQDLIDHTDARKLGSYKNGSNIQQQNGFLTNESINKYLQFIETKGLFVKNNRNWAYITNFEKKLLQNLTQGLSQRDVAVKMGISENLLQKTLNDLKLKLGVISLRDLELTQFYQECRTP